MIKVCGHYVLVLPDPVETMSKSGIYLNTPTTEKQESRARVVGTITQVGPGCWADYDEGAWASVGDKTLYSKYGGTFVTDPESGVEYVVLNDVDIVAIIAEGDDNE